MNDYAFLNQVRKDVEDTLSSLKSTGAIGNYYIEAIPDDLKIEVATFKIVPVKSVRVTVTVHKEEE